MHPENFQNRNSKAENLFLHQGLPAPVGLGIGGTEMGDFVDGNLPRRTILVTFHTGFLHNSSNIRPCLTRPVE